MVTQSVLCKYCHTPAVVKYGTFEGMQRYYCKSCRRKFADNDALPKMKTPVWVIASALSQYYDGKSLSTIQTYLGSRYGAVYGKTSIYNWVIRFSREALNLTTNYVPETGDIWLVCGTSMTVGKRRIWLRDVIDAGTGYLLDSELMLTPGTGDTGKYIAGTSRRTGRSANLVVTTIFNDGESKQETVWYRSPEDIYKYPMIMKEENDNVINRFILTLKTRRAVLRGFKNVVNARLLLATWRIHYNFFKSFATTGHTPPAQKMKGPPVKSWLDLISLSSQNQRSPRSSLLSPERLVYLPPEATRELPVKGKYA